MQEGGTVRRESLQDRATRYHRAINQEVTRRTALVGQEAQKRAREMMDSLFAELDKVIPEVSKPNLIIYPRPQKPVDMGLPYGYSILSEGLELRIEWGPCYTPHVDDLHLSLELRAIDYFLEKGHSVKNAIRFHLDSSYTEQLCWRSDVYNDREFSNAQVAELAIGLLLDEAFRKKLEETKRH